MRRRCAAWIASIAIALTWADVLPGDDDHLSLVPWKVIEPGAELDPAPLVLFWVPASREEMRRSELLTSDELTLYSSQCVSMRVIRIDDYAMLDRLGVDSALPVAVLTDAEMNVLARAGENGALSVADVESMVRDELEDRAEAAEASLDDARRKVEDGDVDAAIELYREVWEQRCVCPRQARAAQRALKRLQK
jgi:hypothetical protein